MKKIQMVDLFGQYTKIKEDIDRAIEETISSSAFINGAAVKTFATELADYLDVKHVIPCANGTDALQIAMMALDLQPGDEVITSNFTFIATVEVIGLMKLKLVLADVDPYTYNLNPAQVRKLISPKTKAIVPVHLFGQAAPMDEIMEISREYNIPVIEDNAQALGAYYKFSDGTKKMAGTIGKIGTTSFFPSKNLGCFGDGGALYTNDDLLGDNIRMITNHGAKVKYHHEIIGVNSRLDTIQAAILNVKLKKLDEYSAARGAAADHYDNALGQHPGIIIPKRSGKGNHVFHQYTIRVPNGKRDALKNALAEKGIPSMVYYPGALSLQKAFSYAGYKPGDFPVSEMLCNEVLSLPMHTELGDDQLEFITETLLACI